MAAKIKNLSIGSTLVFFFLALLVQPASANSKEIAKSFIDAFAAGNKTILQEIVAENLVDHSALPDAKPGRQGLLDVVDLYHAGFANLKITVEKQVAEGDLVVQFGRISGTNIGPMMGTPATGKSTTFAYMEMYRIADGRIVEMWRVQDLFGMVSQLGLISQ